MPDFLTSWSPPPLPGQGDPVAPIETHGDPISGWLSEQWQQQVESAQRVGWMFQYLGGQINPSNPEAELAQLIYRKMGPDYTVVGKGAGPDKNMILARQAAHAAMTDANYRNQLVSAFGWNANNPHVANWVKEGGGPPPDPMGTGLPPGTTAPPNTAATTSTATAVAPFDPNAWGGRATDPGYTYGQVLAPEFAAAAGIDRQWGVDYAMALGTKLPSPFAGTIKEAQFNGPYGNTVVVQLSNGYTYRVAHLNDINVRVGDKVGAGMLLGTVGSTGNSSGPHVLIEMRDPSGKPIDPTPIIESLLKGDGGTATKVLGDYDAAAKRIGPGSGNAFLTSDGHLVYPGSQDYNVYSAAAQFWSKRYGGQPPWSFVSGLIAAGNTTVPQIQSAMDQMTSDIPGLNWGARDALTSDANNAALKAWDRPVPDSTIKQLAAKGLTTPGQIQGWIMSHPASGIAPEDFKTIYDATNPKTQELWKQPPSPEMVRHIYDQMNQGPTG